MYFVFGNEVLDSAELAKNIEEGTKLRLVCDLTKSTKREDTGAFLFRLSANEICCEDINEMAYEDKVDALMKKADEYSNEALKMLPEQARYKIFSFRYDEVENDIEIILVMAHLELGEKKLFDVLNRMLKQI
ncbi:hypothetical protein SAMN02745945_02930 [Peptoclostridium litorale DSM 5388]|uniref:Uncharacterized protein n=1 Tax=Peptoclostridium litorale DSM 5388 TaxID=1121324 RepID=A0A069RBQ7_PEPLI|nr:hypothetical protein [Peptoclostridium litorale]KDR94481.1 hypothetical protein CLIT_17c00080 [Peptoclostridium litorale DSM 5388]SIO35924.1 hypothetical protein SAMN02745945_02930 [Peptoclostridium litorale DSM 5388]